MPLLSCRFLASVLNVNNYVQVDRLWFSEGDQLPVYLQLVDQNQDRPDTGIVPPYRRYCAASSSTLNVTLRNVDQAIQVTRVATQPFPGDASIWSFTVFASDRLRGSVSLLLDLYEAGAHTYANVQPGLSVRAKVV